MIDIAGQIVVAEQHVGQMALTVGRDKRLQRGAIAQDARGNAVPGLERDGHDPAAIGQRARLVLKRLHGRGGRGRRGGRGTGPGLRHKRQSRHRDTGGKTDCLRVHPILHHRPVFPAVLPPPFFPLRETRRQQSTGH
jgi:hypothetical protein